MVRPNMGVAHCFLGDPWGAQVLTKVWAKWTQDVRSNCRKYHKLFLLFQMEEESTENQWAAVAFMTTPEFLYFHSILIGLQVDLILYL